jgi:hypothetical protein
MPPEVRLPEYTVNIKVVASSEDAAIQQVAQKLSEAKEKIEETGQAAEESSGGIDKLKETVKSLAEAFGLVLGAREVIEFFKDLVTEGARDEHMFNNLALSAKIYANATEETIAQAKEWVNWLRVTYAVSNDEIIPAFQKMIAITGNVSQAEKLMTVAAGASKEGFMSMTEAATVLQRYLETGLVMRGVDPVSNALREGKAAGESFATILDTRLIPAFADAGKAVNDNKTELDAWTASWKAGEAEMGQMVGGIKSVIIPALRGLGGALVDIIGGLALVGLEAKYAGKELGAFLGFGVNVQANGLKNALDTLYDQMRDIREEQEEDLAKLGEHFMKAKDIMAGVSVEVKEAGDKAAQATKEQAAASYHFFVESSQKMLDSAKTSSAQRLEILRQEAALARNTFGEQSKEYKDAQTTLVEAEKKAAEEATKVAEEHSKQMKAANDALAKSVLEVARAEESEASAALKSAKSKDDIRIAAGEAQVALKKEREAAKIALAQEKADAIAAAKGNKAAIAVINETYRNKELALEKEFENKRVAINKEADDKIAAIDKAIRDKEKQEADKYAAQLKRAANLLLTNEKKNLQQRLQAVKDFYAQERALAEGNAAALAILDQAETAELKRTKEEQVAINRDAQERIVGAMQGMFAQNKEVSLALAVVAAFEGAARAGAAMASAGPWAAAAAYAETLAQLYAAVKGIRGTDIGSSSGGSGAVSSTASPKMTMPAGYGAPPSTTPAPVYHSTTNQTGGNINVNVQTLISADGDRAVQNLAYQVAKQIPVVNRRMSRAPAVQAGKRGH